MVELPKFRFMIAPGTPAHTRRRIRVCLSVLVIAILLGVQVPRAIAHSAEAARHGMVVAGEPLAADVGVDIMKAGGNAVDAAVAVGFALAVTHPEAGNIGGGGFMLIRLAGGESVVIDYREEAPGGASREMYLNGNGDVIPEASTIGGRAVAVPGTVAGLALAHRKYGKLQWAQVLQPAIRLAQRGFPVSFEFAESLRSESKLLSSDPESKRIFLRDGNPYEPGELFQQPELAATLAQLAKSGPKAFYQGPVAEALASTVKSHHGLIEVSDLKQYQAKLRKPLRGAFRGYEILSAPPPSSGGIGLMEMLNVLEPLDLGHPNSFQSIHLIAQTMRRAYADRAAYLGDADFVDVPAQRLTSPAYAASLREEIVKSKPHDPVREGKPAGFESEETTHYSVIDAEGNAVANTYTLNGVYGSGVTVKGAGFLLNNEMDDFTSKPGVANMYGLIQGEANSIAPRKRPLSAMTPTIVVQNGKVRLILGSPGGGTIINTVLQVMLNVLVYKMDVRQAVTSPRFHHQWMPDRLVLERWGFSADTIMKLEEAGYEIHTRDRMGACEAIAVDPATGWRFGGADPRTAGKAAGY
jgi:gamma-glutamyltranspeptidase/glutathione hydrolase